MYLFNFSPRNTHSSSICDGREHEGDGCNESRDSCEGCGGKWCTNACEPFQCPPRNDISLEEAILKNQQLCKIQASLKRRGYEANLREETIFLERGYATYESSVWRKPKSCQKLLNDDLITNNHWSMYKADAVEDYVKKLFNDEYNLVFLRNHKVASTSFPEYLDCEYGAWNEVARDEPNDDRRIIVAVRDPLSRFVSATGEILQRIVNHFCIDHSCGEIDHFSNETFHKVKHQTSWFSLLNNPSWSSSDLLPDLIRAIVNDLKCNYASYALDHYTSQSVFVSQNKGTSDPIDVIIQIENSNNGLAKISAHTRGESNHCSLKESNSALTKPKGIPSSKEIFKVINENDSIIRELCLIYIQVSYL